MQRNATKTVISITTVYIPEVVSPRRNCTINLPKGAKNDDIMRLFVSCIYVRAHPARYTCICTPAGGKHITSKVISYDRPIALHQSVQDVHSVGYKVHFLPR